MATPSSSAKKKKKKNKRKSSAGGDVLGKHPAIPLDCDSLAQRPALHL